MSVGPRAEKFNIVSNNHGRTHKCDFSIFDRRFLLWANLVKKKQNCQFKLKLGTETISNIQNSVVVFTLFVLDWKCPFWTNLFQKIKNVSLGWNLGHQLANSNMQNSLALITFSISDRKHTFWANLIQKIAC